MCYCNNINDLSIGSPTITVEPVETVVDAGSTVVLNCQAEGEPVPVIEWSRQGRPLLGNERITTLNNGSLRLSSAQKEDTAEYECVARNLLGSVLVRVTLTVRGELRTLASIRITMQLDVLTWPIELCVSQFMEVSLNGWSGELAVFPAVQECRGD